MVWTGAVCVLAHEGCTLAHLGDGRVGIRVEEVVLGENSLVCRGCIFVLEAKSCRRSLRKS